MRFVYTMICEPIGDVRFVKFGLTSCIYSRAKTIQGGCPLYVESAISVEVGDDVTQKFIEASLHCEYEDRHSAGEWFRFDECDDFGLSIERAMLDVVCKVGYSSPRVRRYKFKAPGDRRVKARRGHEAIRKAYMSRPGKPVEYDAVVGNCTEMPPVAYRGRRQSVSSFKDSLKVR